MNTKNRLVACIAAAGMISAFKPVLADTTVGSASDDAKMQKVLAQTETLEHQMKALKAEIRQLKSEQNTLKKAQVKSNKAVSGNHPYSVNSKEGVDSSMNYTTGSPVVISSYLGEHTAFDASDLIINYTDYNESLNLLRLKQKVYKRLNCGTDSLTLPFLMVSGKIEGLAAYQKPSHDVSSNSVSLEDAELDIAPVINDWASGFMAIQYSSSNEMNPAPRVINDARLHLKKGFITFGNLEATPVYFTMGQWNMPFGQYSNPMISNPLTQDIFQTRSQAVLLGYAHQDGRGLYAQTYAFNGDTNTNRSGNINNVGANVGYVIKNNTWNSEFGAGIIGNVADSLGMQQTNGSAGFAGFGTATITNPVADKLQRRVAGADVHASFGTGPVSLSGEYEQATSSFNTQDLTFNGRGAQPKALDVEGSYSFHVSQKPVAFNLGYGKSWDALALAVPQDRYVAALTTSFCKDTIEELELRHDKFYKSSDSASGFGVETPASMKGYSANTVLAQIGIYF